MRNFSVEETLERLLKKLFKKDKTMYDQIMGKMDEIISCENIDHYKNLKKPLQNVKRTHVGSFVLIFKHNKKDDRIVFYDFDHHNNIYR